METKRAELCPEELADVRAVAECVAAGRPVPEDVARRVRERAGKIREEVLHACGVNGAGARPVREDHASVGGEPAQALTHAPEGERDESSDGPDLTEAEQVRLYCHFLIQQLDDRGLREAVDALTEMVQFYEEAPEQRKPPEGKSTTARFTGSYVEPVYPVTEE